MAIGRVAHYESSTVSDTLSSDLIGHVTAVSTVSQMIVLDLDSCMVKRTFRGCIKQRESTEGRDCLFNTHARDRF